MVPKHRPLDTLLCEEMDVDESDFGTTLQRLAHGGDGAENGNFCLHYSSGAAIFCASVSPRNDSIGGDSIFENC